MKLSSYSEVVKSQVIEWDGSNAHCIFVNKDATAKIAKKRGWVEITEAYHAAQAPKPKAKPKPEPKAEAPKKTTRRRAKKSE